MSEVLIINKKPLDEYERILPNKHFPHMPILYLEFLENKTKVKKEYINKNYIPSSIIKKPVKPTDPPIHTQRGATLDPTARPSGQGASASLPIEADTFDATARKAEGVTITDILDDDDDTSDRDGPDTDLVLDSGRRQDHDKIIEHQLHDLLGEDKPFGPGLEGTLRPLCNPTSQNPQQDVEEQKSPPTLEELQKKKNNASGTQAFTISRDYRYAEEEDEETQKERNAVYFKYEVLRRMHPNANIPEFTIYSDPKLMAQKYELLTKKLSLESSVDSWKRYMIVFVMGCEVVLGKLSFDMEGFAQQQIMSMSTYDQLLVEMAEKSYVPSGSSKWSPEVRLFMMLTVNIVLFVISKMIFKKTGTNLLGTINDLTSPQERKMKEPSSE